MKTFRNGILLVFVFAGFLSGQIKTNFDWMNNLVDSSANNIKSQLSGISEIKIDFRTPVEYESLNPRLVNALSRFGIRINNKTADNTIYYSIDNSGVEYSDLFKDGLFGGYIIIRKIHLNGEFEIKRGSEIIDADTFNLAIADTINFDKLNSIETNSLPFTKGKTPSEPFFPSILEPVVAITTVVVTVILFFSVRSN